MQALALGYYLGLHDLAIRDRESKGPGELAGRSEYKTNRTGLTSLPGKWQENR